MGVLPDQVGLDNLRRQRHESPVGAFRTGVGLFAAQPRLPLVFAQGHVATLPGFQAVAAPGAHVLPVPEQGEEEGDLLLGGVDTVLEGEFLLESGPNFF